MMPRRTMIGGLVLSLLLILSPVFSQGPVWRAQRAIVAVPRVPAIAIQQRLRQTFYDYRVFQLDLSEVAERARSTGHLTLDFGTRVFDLLIEPNDLRAPTFRRTLTTARGVIDQPWSPVATFKGQVSGDPESVVRLLILPNLLQGYVRTAEEWMFIDPLVKYAPGSDATEVVLFRDEDVRPEALGRCGAGELIRLAEKFMPGLHDQTGMPTAQSTSLQRAEVATDADYEYFQIYGNNANAQIEGVINAVDGIYQNQLGLTLEITFQNVFTTSSQPYTSTDPSTLLDQFRNYWNANQQNVNRDLAHLFTGKDMNGGVIGIAYVGVVCSSPSFSYGVSQDFSLMTKLVAHEMGHNFNAVHDPPSICNGSGPIMCAAIQPNGPEEFSTQSVNDITAFVDAHGNCLDAVGGGPGPSPPPSGCAAETAMQESSQRESALTVLRRIRDEVLPRTARGRQYIQWFNEHTVEVSMLMIEDERLRDETRSLIERLLPHFRALANGRSTTLTQAEVARIDDLLLQLRPRASFQLRRVIDAIRRDLHNRRVLRSFRVSVSR